MNNLHALRNANPIHQAVGIAVIAWVAYVTKTQTPGGPGPIKPPNEPSPPSGKWPGLPGWPGQDNVPPTSTTTITKVLPPVTKVIVSTSMKTSTATDTVTSTRFTHWWEPLYQAATGTVPETAPSSPWWNAIETALLVYSVLMLLGNVFAFFKWLRDVLSGKREPTLKEQVRAILAQEGEKDQALVNGCDCGDRARQEIDEDGIVARAVQEALRSIGDARNPPQIDEEALVARTVEEVLKNFDDAQSNGQKGDSKDKSKDDSKKDSMDEQTRKDIKDLKDLKEEIEWLKKNTPTLKAINAQQIDGNFQAFKKHFEEEWASLKNQQDIYVNDALKKQADQNEKDSEDIRKDKEKTREAYERFADALEKLNDRFDEGKLPWMQLDDEFIERLRVMEQEMLGKAGLSVSEKAELEKLLAEEAKRDTQERIARLKADVRLPFDARRSSGDSDASGEDKDTGGGDDEYDPDDLYSISPATKLRYEQQGYPSHIQSNRKTGGVSGSGGSTTQDGAGGTRADGGEGGLSFAERLANAAARAKDGVQNALGREPGNESGKPVAPPAGRMGPIASEGSSSKPEDSLDGKNGKGSPSRKA